MRTQEIFSQTRNNYLKALLRYAADATHSAAANGSATAPTVTSQTLKNIHERVSIAVLLTSAALAAVNVARTGWLDRLVQYQKQRLFNEVRELAPINIKAEIRPKPEGYEDSAHWDYDSVLRLLTLIRGSETSKPVHRALRRMLQPTRRIMMSMKESMHRFPSIKKEDNYFYYDVEYTSSEEGQLPAPPPVPEDEVVLVVSNPVEARLPSAKISVKLLREILEARARAARQMSTTTTIPPWLEFVRNRTRGPPSEATKGSDADGSTSATGGADTTAADGGSEGTTGAGGEATPTGAGGDTGGPDTTAAGLGTT